jgi:hypothetical protein
MNVLILQANAALLGGHWQEAPRYPSGAGGQRQQNQEELMLPIAATSLSAETDSG